MSKKCENIDLSDAKYSDLSNDEASSRSKIEDDVKANLNCDEDESPRKPSIFIARRSMLSDLRDENESLDTIASLIWLITSFTFITSIINYYFNPESLFKDIDLIRSSFENFYPIGITALLFFHHCYLTQWILLKCIYSIPGLIAAEIPFALIFICIPLYIVFYQSTGPTLRLVICTEHTRMAMKMWSLFAENYCIHPRQRATLKQAVYFAFAPTLIFRKRYPNTVSRDWNKVLIHVTQFFLSVLTMLRILGSQVIPAIERIARKDIDREEIPWFIFQFTLYIGLIQMTLWYLIFHAWLNIWAEMLQFGDRLFYSDWWNAKSQAYFMPNFNRVVHLFIREYIYKPILKATNSKIYGFTGSLTISVIFHEYISCIPLRFFLPIWMAINLPQQFAATLGLNLAFISISKTVFIFNYFLINFLVSFYGIEYFARKNCHQLFESPMIDAFIPYFIFCQSINHANQTTIMTGV